jgi:hypothetical protein
VDGSNDKEEKERASVAPFTLEEGLLVSLIPRIVRNLIARNSEGEA